jgi:hypothetical protein
MTDHEIAATLTIAFKSATVHVEHRRTELGFSGRSPIAVWIAAQG